MFQLLQLIKVLPDSSDLPTDLHPMLHSFAEYGFRIK